MTFALQLVAGGRHRTVDIPALGGAGRAQLNFGSAPGSGEARVAVAAPGILATSTPVAQRLILASVDHSEDEHMVEDLDVFAGYVRAGVGFTIVGRPRNPARLYGIFNVSWSWS